MIITILLMIKMRNDDFTIVTLNRKQIDLVFYNKMLESKVGKLKARTMWLAVRTFGWQFYKK